eukprot:TRINITY_DN35184_c0_g2_i1.p1 TRINITY_DN35184_c0_g2~~TRINITY_DN35184_c0_g2_i1.p1  ORF type:complete len:569 (+),score=80.36 TRINITY_DN35184_c0_g2_i1:148-1854(+)
MSVNSNYSVPTNLVPQPSHGVVNRWQGSPVAPVRNSVVGNFKPTPSNIGSAAQTQPVVTLSASPQSVGHPCVGGGVAPITYVSADVSSCLGGFGPSAVVAGGGSGYGSKLYSGGSMGTNQIGAAVPQPMSSVHREVLRSASPARRMPGIPSVGSVSMAMPEGMRSSSPTRQMPVIPSGSSVNMAMPEMLRPASPSWRISRIPSGSSLNIAAPEVMRSASPTKQLSGVPGGSSASRVIPEMMRSASPNRRVSGVPIGGSVSAAIHEGGGSPALNSVVVRGSSYISAQYGQPSVLQNAALDQQDSPSPSIPHFVPVSSNIASLDTSSRHASALGGGLCGGCGSCSSRSTPFEETCSQQISMLSSTPSTWVNVSTQNPRPAAEMQLLHEQSQSFPPFLNSNPPFYWVPSVDTVTDFEVSGTHGEVVTKTGDFDADSALAISGTLRMTKGGLYAWTFQIVRQNPQRPQIQFGIHGVNQTRPWRLVNSGRCSRCRDDGPWLVRPSGDMAIVEGDYVHCEVDLRGLDAPLGHFNFAVNDQEMETVFEDIPLSEGPLQPTLLMSGGGTMCRVCPS